MSCDPSVWGSQEAHWSPQRSSQRRVFSPNAHRSQEGRKWVKEMQRTRVPGEDQLRLLGVVEKQDAVWWYGLKFIKLKISIHVPYTHVHMWNVLKAVHEVENMDAPWMEGWTLLWAGRKPGHTKKEKLGTCEMIIILLCQLYMRRRKI